MIVLQLGSATMASFGLLASLGVLQALFAQGATPDRVRAALPSLTLVVGLLMTRAMMDAGVTLFQQRLTPSVRRLLETEFLHLTARVRLEAVDDAAWSDDATARTTAACTTPSSPSPRSWNWPPRSSAYRRRLGPHLSAPLLLPLLIASVIPQGLASVRSARARFLSQVRHSTLRRRMRLFSWLLLDERSAAELRSSTAQPALLAEHERLAVTIEQEEARLGREAARAG